MTITELYNRLSDKNFQDYQTGNLFFPAYMYMYDATKEYEIDAEIRDIRDRLHRPNNYLDVLVLDIFEEFISFLKELKFGKGSKYEFLIEHELDKPDAVHKALKTEAYDKRFLKYLDDKITRHLQNSGDYEVAFVFLKGFGNSFPYIRASRFMNNFEQFINGYKLIMFYPGTVKEYYSLFGILKDENLYRAIKLIND